MSLHFSRVFIDCLFTAEYNTLSHPFDTIHCLCPVLNTCLILHILKAKCTLCASVICLSCVSLPVCRWLCFIVTVYVSVLLLLVLPLLMRFVVILCFVFIVVSLRVSPLLSKFHYHNIRFVAAVCVKINCMLSSVCGCLLHCVMLVTILIPW